MATVKVAVVTGSNKGIGYGIVKGLCEKFNGIVYLTARDVGRGESAVAKLKELGLNPSFHQLDIDDQNSVDTFRNYLKEKYGGIDILVNNAGIAFKREDVEPMGVQAEVTMKTNYFGHLRVCEALFPLLRTNARVIDITTSLGMIREIPSKELRAKFSDPNLTISKLNELMNQFVRDAKDGKATSETWGTSCYGISKAGMGTLSLLHQSLFDKEQPNRNISVNFVHPGYVATDMSSFRGPMSVEQAVKAPLYLALEADSNLKGKFIWYDCQIVDWFGESSPTPF